MQRQINHRAPSIILRHVSYDPIHPPDQVHQGTLAVARKNCHWNDQGATGNAERSISPGNATHVSTVSVTVVRLVEWVPVEHARFIGSRRIGEVRVIALDAGVNYVNVDGRLVLVSFIVRQIQESDVPFR